MEECPRCFWLHQHKLMEKKQPIDDIFIVCDVIGKQARGMYKRARERGKKGYFLYDKNLDKFAEIKCNGKIFQIGVFYNSEI